LWHTSVVPRFDKGSVSMARRAVRYAEKSTSRPAPSAPRGSRTAAPSAAGKPAKLEKPVKAKVADKAPAKALVKLPGKLDLDGLTADQKVTALLREREKLLTRLSAAETRSAAMEARDEQLSDRIAWALDTLNDLLRVTDAP
jgi:hypothetical protein